MRESFLPFAPPDIGDDELAEVADSLRSGWITTGPRARRFEEAFAARVGADAALAQSSGTAALHTSLLAFGLGPGDAVVLPTMTFVSAVNVVEQVGARPLLVDVDPLTLNVDPAAVVRAIESSPVPVRCLAPVHLHGQPCDLPALIEIAEHHDAVIIDDAAHALPACIGDTVIGGSKHPRVLTAFSFYATKNLTTGEGGMLTGSPDRLAEARAWSLHGMTYDAWSRYDAGASWRYDVDRAGFKYNLSDIQAALGLVQLNRLDEMHARRREIARRYGEGLRQIEAIQTPVECPGTQHAWHIYAIRLHLDRLTISRDRFMEEMNARRIATSVHFIPAHTFSYYRDRYGYSADDFPVAWSEFHRLVSLPIHPRMSDRDVDDVLEAVSDIVRANIR